VPGTKVSQHLTHAGKDLILFNWLVKY
jgi:hypothetical protein